MFTLHIKIRKRDYYDEAFFSNLCGNGDEKVKEIVIFSVKTNIK